MFDHLGFTTTDLDASVRFYTAALKQLGYEVTSRDEGSAGFGNADATPLWIYGGGAKKPAKGAHIAFAAKDQGAVDRFYKAGLAAGGKDNGAPGLRKDYSPKYYAAFLFDPDGNNVEAVCLK
jgi:catechol 2,3-dioxygenase-like lactoylglutathione lyase family enzyme